MNISQSMIAVVMGGGAGTRLYPLTASRSKPAVPIAAKYRLVDIPISNCMNSDITRIFVLTQFNSASLNRHIKNTYQFSVFSRAFVDILAAEQRPNRTLWYQGTADAVRQSLYHLQEHEFEYVLILSGDQLYQIDFGEMLEQHIEKNAQISIATIPVDKNDAPDFGILKKRADGFIDSFIEKPKEDVLADWTSEVHDTMKAQGRVYLASMGIYIFNRDILFETLNEQSVATDFGKEIIPQAINEFPVLSYEYDGYWTDIGSIPSFFEANMELTQDVPRFNLFDNKRYIYTRARMLPPTKMSGTTVEKSLVAEGCIINAGRLEQSLIGIRTRIGAGSMIYRCYLMGHDFYQTIEEMDADTLNGMPFVGVGERCMLKNCIVDKGARIGNDVHINGGIHLTDADTDSYTIKEGIVIIKKNAIIPNGFRLE